MTLLVTGDFFADRPCALRQVLKKMQYQIPKADVDAVVQCKPGAIEQVNQR